MKSEVSVLGFSTAEECGSLKILKNLEEFAVLKICGMETEVI